MRGIVSLLILVALICGISVFSIFAHDKVESSNNEQLKAQVESLQQQNDRLLKSKKSILKEAKSSRSDLEDSLFIAFPSKPDQERIAAAINAAFGTANTDEKTEEETTEEDQAETTEEVENI